MKKIMVVKILYFENYYNNMIVFELNLRIG